MIDVRDILVMLATLMCLLGLVRVASAEELEVASTSQMYMEAEEAREAELAEAAASTTLTAGAEAPQKAWTAGFTTQHYWSHRADLRSFTEFTLEGRYKLSDRHSLQALLPAVKYYEVGTYGESEFELDDTSLFHFYTIVPDWNQFQLQVRSGLTLPTASTSRDAGNISKPSLQLRLTRKFFNDKLTLSYRPSITVPVNQYKNTLSGTPLTKFSMGHALVGEYRFMDNLAVGVALQGAYHFKYQGQGATKQGPPNGAYGFDAYLGYDWTDFLSVSLGYYQGDSFIKDGRYEVLVFDPYTTRFYISLGITL